MGVVQEPLPASAGTVGEQAFLELGSTGLLTSGGYVSEEWLDKLIGHLGLRAYREMRDNDPIVGAIMHCIEMLLRGVAWTVEPASDSFFRR